MKDYSAALRARTGAGLTGGASMAASNTVSTHPAGTGPGSESEAVPADVIREPGPFVPAPRDYRRGTGGTRDASPWAAADGGPWADAAEPDPAPGQGGPGRWRQR